MLPKTKTSGERLYRYVSVVQGKSAYSLAIALHIEPQKTREALLRLVNRGKLRREYDGFIYRYYLNGKSETPSV